MKYFKLLRDYNGRLFSYNSDVRDGLSVEYQIGEWTEPNIKGSGLYCLSGKAVDLVKDNRFALAYGGDGFLYTFFEVEISNQIPLSKSFFSDEAHITGAKLKKYIVEGRRANRGALEFLLDVFPSVVITDKVKLVRRVFP